MLVAERIIPEALASQGVPEHVNLVIEGEPYGFGMGFSQVGNHPRAFCRVYRRLSRDMQAFLLSQGLDMGGFARALYARTSQLELPAYGVKLHLGLWRKEVETAGLRPHLDAWLGQLRIDCEVR